MIEVSLPPFLHNIEPLEMEDLPLQVALLTMEIASLREKLTALSRSLTETALRVEPDLFLEEVTTRDV